MKKIFLSAGIISLSMLGLSCKTSTILKTNFNSEALGITPSHDIPGDPSGDRIEFIPELAPGLKLREWNATGTKGLEYSYVNTGEISGHYTWLSFRGISTNFAQTVWYMYTAKHEGNFGDLLTDLSDGSGAYIARMRISSSGSVSLIGGDWVTSRVIGSIPPGTIHTVIFTVNVAQSTYNLLIASSGRELIQVSNEPLMTSNPLDFHNPTNPSISFQLGDGSGQGSKYTIESLLITRKDPTGK